LFGDSDSIAPLAVGEYLSTKMPQAKLEVFAGATHNLLEERANELAPVIARHIISSSVL
jgi:pimeloyl-ACP methyl ester carboxylesterase